MGTPLMDLDTLLAEASPQLRAVIERACGLAQHRSASARAIEAAIAAYETAPFLEPRASAKLPALELLTATDLCRALMALHPELWAKLSLVDRPVPALSERWRALSIDEGHRLALQPALARRLTWARKKQPLSEPRELFCLLDSDAVAPLAAHQAQHREGLITTAEAIFALLRELTTNAWVGLLPAPYVELGSRDALYELVSDSSRSSPVVVVCGEAGSGRRTLTLATMAKLRHSEQFGGWGFNIDNYHGGFADPEQAPAFVALSERCVASYGSDDLELLEALVRSARERTEDTRLILRTSPSAQAKLVQRVPAAAQFPTLALPAPDMRTRTAALVAHMVILNDWFRADWGVPEAIAIARQTQSVDSLALVLACADQALAQQVSPEAYNLACARSHTQLPDHWRLSPVHSAPSDSDDLTHSRACAMLADPRWRPLSPKRSRRLVRRFTAEHPELHAALVELATSLHIRSC